MKSLTPSWQSQDNDDAYQLLYLATVTVESPSQEKCSSTAKTEKHLGNMCVCVQVRMCRHGHFTLKFFACQSAM